nr:hypothetical protein [Chloroflexota bacterium]
YDVCTPSRFLADIPAGVLNGQPAKPHVADTAARETRERATTWETPLARNSGRAVRVAPAPESDSRYRTGQRGKHAKFGEGLIIESTGSGDDEILVIAFEQTGLKRLAASVAELKVLT